MKKNVGIIGEGKIAERLQERLKEAKDEVCFVAQKDPEGSYVDLILKHRENLNAVFLAPGLDDRVSDKYYILECVRRGIPVIVSEPDAFANNFEELKPHMRLIGCNAIVGGGTGMIKYVKGCRPNSQPMQISMVLNSTLNLIFDEMSRGQTFWDACAMAIDLKIVERGKRNVPGLVNREMKDVMKKICAFFNTVLSREIIINPKWLNGSLEQSEDDVQKLSDHGASLRMIVSFSNLNSDTGDILSDSVGKVSRTKLSDGWVISAGFRKVAHLSEFKKWIPAGTENAVQVVVGELGEGGVYRLSGSGVGVMKVTSVMLADYDQLCP